MTRAWEWLAFSLWLIMDVLVDRAQMFSITAEAGGIPAVYDDAEIARLPQLQNLTTELAAMTTKCVCVKAFCQAGSVRLRGLSPWKNFAC